MVYVATREGLPEANRRQFPQNLDPRLQGVLLQLENAVLPAPHHQAKDAAAGNGEKLRISKARQTEFAKHLKALQNDPGSMILQRYLPALHTVMAGLVAGGLDPQEYPCINGDVVIDMSGAGGGAGESHCCVPRVYFECGLFIQCSTPISRAELSLRACVCVCVSANPFRSACDGRRFEVCLMKMRSVLVLIFF